MYVFKGVRSSGFLEGVVQVIVEFLGVDERVFEVHFFRVWFGFLPSLAFALFHGFGIWRFGFGGQTWVKVIYFNLSSSFKFEF